LSGKSNTKISLDSDLFTKKVSAKEIFGSNLILAEKQARVIEPKSGADAPRNQWTALCAASEMVGQKPKLTIWEHLYDCARTYFIKNS
jgi:hypothetical protein